MSEPDATAPLEPRPRKTPVRLWIVLGLGIPLLLVGLAVGAVAWRFFQHRSAAHAAVEAEVARIQAAGEPITVADMYAYHQAPQGVRDTTELWLAALRSFDSENLALDVRGIPILREDVEEQRLAPDAPDSVISQAEQFLASYDATIQATLAAAAAEGECRYPIAFEQGLSASSPHNSSVRDLARIFSLRARVSAYRDKRAAMLESLQTIVAIGNSQERSPNVVDQLVRVACLGSAMNQAEFFLNEFALQEDELAEFQKLFAGIEFAKPLQRGAIGERAMAYHIFHHMASVADEPSPELEKWEGKLLQPADCQFYLTEMRVLVDGFDQPYVEAYASAKQSNARLEADMQAGYGLNKLNRLTSALLLPAMEAYASQRGVNEALRDTLVAAIAAERYRLEHGRFPDELAALVPDLLDKVPVDPFDGQSLRLVSDDTQCRVYSIGRDFVDNGGQEVAERREPDLVVQVSAKKNRE